MPLVRPYRVTYRAEDAEPASRVVLADTERHAAIMFLQRELAPHKPNQPQFRLFRRVADSDAVTVGAVESFRVTLRKGSGSWIVMAATAESAAKRATRAFHSKAAAVPVDLIAWLETLTDLELRWLCYGTWGRRDDWRKDNPLRNRVRGVWEHLIKRYPPHRPMRHGTRASVVYALRLATMLDWMGIEETRISNFDGPDKRTTPT